MNTTTSVVVKVTRNKSRYDAYDVHGNRFTDKIYTNLRKKAFDSNQALEQSTSPSGKVKWNLVPLGKFQTQTQTPAPVLNMAVTPEQKDIQNFIHGSYGLKPDILVMNEVKWKYLIRSGIRGKNILLLGPSGCGKTLAARALVEALKRSDRYFYFNLGATQDPRSALIGNTHFSKDNGGTFFAESTFVKAIRTENAIILLDEISRAHPDAWNILMTALDPLQRYLRLDEKDGSEVVKVASGVTFISTANVGNEYTATRIIDKAIFDRFTPIEVDTLSEEEEFNLLLKLHPTAPQTMLRNIVNLTTHTRDMVKQEASKLTNSLSTRTAVEMASLAADGFSLAEIAEAMVYPHFSADGGVDSERTYIKQYLQKFIDNDTVPFSPFQDVNNSKSVPF